jgi:hypothetical protein
MSGYEWYRLSVDLITLGILPLVLFIGKTVYMTRTNDLKHIEDRLDKIEKKIDDHIEWHLNHKD